MRSGPEKHLETPLVLALSDRSTDTINVEKRLGEKEDFDDRITRERGYEDEKSDDQRNRRLFDSDPKRIELEQSDPAGEEHGDESDERDPIRLPTDELIIHAIPYGERDRDEERDRRFKGQVDEEQRRDDDVERDVHERILIRAHERGGRRTVYKHSNMSVRMDGTKGVDVILASALIIRDGALLLLHRTDHDHYETPGGKLTASDCADPENPTEDDLLRCALRELEEEVDCTAEPFGTMIEHRFTLRDGRSAYVAKFPMRSLSGSLMTKEPLFDEARFVPVDELSSLRLSPDLSELLDEIETLIRIIEA